MNNFGNALKNQLGIKEQENKYYDENFKLDIQSQNDSHAIMAREVNENSFCLDVGCSVGYIGELLNKCKKCKVDGIEIDAKAIEMAKNKKCYHHIYSFSITDPQNENYKNFFLNSTKYDYILFGDVLEHLVDPAEILYLFSKKLKDNGKMIVSIPNIAHIDIPIHLFNKTFNYNTTGLLDSTHLRFFTKNSFNQMLININNTYQTNLTITKVVNTNCIPEYINKYPYLFELLKDDTELFAFQYIFIIENSPISKSVVIHKSNNMAKIEKQLDAYQKNLKEIQNLQKQIKGYQNQINECHTLINNIINSSSWKITKPLRNLNNLLSKKK